MPDDPSKKKPTYARLVAISLVELFLMMAALFLLAGRLDYWQGWSLFGLFLVVFLVVLGVFRGKADLLQERAHPGPGTRTWDKVWLASYITAFLAIMVIAALDAGRFGWSPALEVPVYAAAYLGLAVAMALLHWAMWTNRFFSSLVRIQSELGHVVVQSGPYRFVRHPGYVAGILLGLCMPLTFGSLWALIPGGFNVLLVILRTYLEDATLQAELSGYSDYVKKVRYRLLPGVW